MERGEKAAINKGERRTPSPALPGASAGPGAANKVLRGELLGKGAGWRGAGGRAAAGGGVLQGTRGGIPQPAPGPRSPHCGASPRPPHRSELPWHRRDLGPLRSPSAAPAGGRGTRAPAAELGRGAAAGSGLARAAAKDPEPSGGAAPGPSLRRPRSLAAAAPRSAPSPPPHWSLAAAALLHSSLVSLTLHPGFFPRQWGPQHTPFLRQSEINSPHRHVK